MLLYNLGIRLYALFIRFAAFFNPKAKLWVSGRQSWKTELEQGLRPFANGKRIWMHCASLGEFEQGRPVLEALRIRYPDACLILSFFSPSGYEIMKDYKGADLVCYLPIDTPANAKRFISMLKPSVALFVKYEFWLNYLKTLKTEAIPAYLISAVFRTSQPFFKWYGAIFRNALPSYNHIFVQDEFSATLLSQLGFNQSTVCGDTRIDRVLTISAEAKKDLSFLEKFKANSRLILAGSTWSKDDELLIPVFKQLTLKIKGIKLVIAPHEVDERNVNRITGLLKQSGINYIRFSDLDKKEWDGASADVFILDAIGYLSNAYRLAHVAYVGGGFNGGIHSILEPAAFGLPLVFGPQHQKFNEARALLSMGGATEVTEPEECGRILETLISDPETHVQKSERVKQFMARNKGATHRIMEHLKF